MESANGRQKENVNKDDVKISKIAQRLQNSLLTLERLGGRKGGGLYLGQYVKGLER
jgi:hypothetical protein